MCSLLVAHAEVAATVMVGPVLNDVGHDVAQSVAVLEVNDARRCPRGAVWLVLGIRRSVLHDGKLKELGVVLVATRIGAEELELRARGAAATAVECMGIAAYTY